MRDRFAHDPQGRSLFRKIGTEILVVGGAAGVAQVLAIVIIPLITRLYGPVPFGRFAVFSAAVTIVYPLASLRYEWALPLPRDDSSALAVLSLSIALLTCSSLALAVLAASAWVALGSSTGISLAELVLFPVAVAVCGLNGVITNWLTRQRAFTELARLRFATTTAMVALQAAIGMNWPDEIGLILAYLGGNILGISTGLANCRRALALSVHCVRVAALRRTAVEYRLFPLITAPSNVVNAIGSQLPSLVFPSLYGLAVAGQFSLAQRVLGQPASIICQAVNQVYWGNAAQILMDEPGRLWPLFVRLNLLLLLVTVAPAVMLSWIGPQLFSFVFGPAWSEAGQYAGVLVLPTLVGLAAQSTTSLHVYRLNHWMGAWEVLQLFLVGAALATAAYTGNGPVWGVVTVALALAAANAVLLALNAVGLLRTVHRAVIARPPAVPQSCGTGLDDTATARRA